MMRAARAVADPAGFFEPAGFLLTGQRGDWRLAYRVLTQKQKAHNALLKLVNFQRFSHYPLGTRCLTA